MTITYPSGMVLSVGYSHERVASLSVKPAGATSTSTLLKSIGYYPFSQNPTAWTWGNGSAYGRSLDTNGRVTSVSLGPRQRSYGYDAGGRVKSH